MDRITNKTTSPRRWTFAEIDEKMHGKAICTLAGRGLYIIARCNMDPEAEPPMGDDEAFFDVAPSWADSIGQFDKCDRSISDLERRIQARFPAPKGWSYDPASDIIQQC